MLFAHQQISGVQEITYESAVRVVCFGLTPAILAMLPLFGGFVSAICVVIVTVIGAREVYRTTTGRAVVIALFPKLLFLGVLGIGLFVLLLAAVKFFASTL